MRMKYISRIQSNLKGFKNIHTNRVTSRILDGSYNSVYKGRSMNFDELREYVPGDEIRDIDWKASSRSRKLLVRQYIAEKKHNVMLVFDANKRMLADTEDGEEKREVAWMSAGTLAYLVGKNGDYISATYASEKGVRHFPFRTGLVNIETILAGYCHDVTTKNTQDINVPLDYISKHMHRRMIIAIVTDLNGVHALSEVILKRLLVLHDVLVLCVGDAQLGGKKVFDVESSDYLPAFFSEDKKLVKQESSKRNQMQQECDEKLKRLGIVSAKIEKSKGLDNCIMELLNRHKAERS